MPMFITYASYSQSGAKGLIDKPADRSGVIKALIEKAGGKLIALYFTTGSNDVVLISEVADGSDAVAVGMAVSASGSLSKIETVRAWTPSEFKGIAGKRLPRLPVPTLRPENDEQCTALCSAVRIHHL